MSKIHQAFENGKALIPFITCGDPDLETTKQLILALEQSGASLIELGIPFSDPTAEGPVIAQASLRALQAGTTTDRIFAMVEDVRRQTDIPLVFMTYANVVYSYGAERFLKSCEALGIDGLILPDVPFEEKEEFLDVCTRHHVDLISMIAPTSASRIEKIAREASGFIYLVSSLGVTGERSGFAAELASIVAQIRAVTNVPVAIGFGIHTPEQAADMAELADGVIVGSAFVRQIEKQKTDCLPAIRAFAGSLKQAIEV